MSTSSTSNDHRELLGMAKGSGLKKKKKKKSTGGSKSGKPEQLAFQGSFTRGPYIWGHKRSTKVV
eukprot:scaffold17310_cov72-Skeletonema_dohrnii-CCMP3373.AAC.1